METMDTTQAARGLYGPGWLDLPELARREAEGFLADLLDLDATAVANGDALDACWEAADRVCPIYYHEQMELLADDEVWGWVEDHSEGGTPQQDGEGLYVYACRAAAGQYVQALSCVFGSMVEGLSRPEGWCALGLDYDAADVAATLLPEWSGTVTELLEAAPRLAAEAVAR